MPDAEGFEKWFSDDDGWVLACRKDGLSWRWFALRPRRFGSFSAGHDPVPLGIGGWRAACTWFKRAVEGDAAYARWCVTNRRLGRPLVDRLALERRVEVTGHWRRKG